MQEPVKSAGDVVAGFTALAAVAQWAPPLAAIAALIYTCLRIYEWFERRRKRKHWFDARTGHEDE